MGNSSAEILISLKQNRSEELLRIRQSLGSPEHPFHRVIGSLTQMAPENMEKPFSRQKPLNTEEIISIQEEIYNHIMSHPVWVHPFLLTFTEGKLSREAMQLFAAHFFNYVKNTSQSTALSIGKFYSLTPGHHGLLSERISELTRLVLTQSNADEFSLDHRNTHRNFDMMRLLNPHTNSSSYRLFLEKLGLPFSSQDIPMTHSLADSVLIMRLLAGSDSFTELESLASVGVNEIWGVPELYTLILTGIQKFSSHTGLSFTANELEVFRNHTKQDLSYSLSFMLVAALHFHNEQPVSSVKNVINIILAARYAMFSDLYRIVSEKEAPRLYEQETHKQFLVGDRRIENELIIARQKLFENTVVSINEYKDKKATPFVFKDI